MATLVTPPLTVERGERFFLIGAILMTIILCGGFSNALAMGISSFHALYCYPWIPLSRG